jgi:hypothetical protein
MRSVDCFSRSVFKMAEEEGVITSECDGAGWSGALLGTLVLITSVSILLEEVVHPIIKKRKYLCEKRS